MKTLFFVLLITNFSVFAQIDSLVEELPRPDANWETEFQQRIDLIYGARIPGYTFNPGSGVDDGGKWEWPRFLAKMRYPTSNPTTSTMSGYITSGRSMVNGANVGSFYKPFSCAGYAMYFFNWKDSILKYDPTQIDLVYSDVQSMMYMLMRQDHVFDECCGYNLYGGKEFNSENFHWMMRSAGYLFAHELHGKNINGTVYNMYSFNMSSQGIFLHTGLASPKTSTIYPQNVNVIGYFDGFVKNLTRALYNAGRVEWNSNNYYGHTLNPLMTLYQNADKCNDPNGMVNKKRAKACVDWMMVEAAVRFQDGFQAAADARAKTGSFKPFAGSVYQYTIPYFTDNNHPLTFHNNTWSYVNPGEMEVGFLLNSDYRPPQIVIDIAQRKFDFPVEIQSAKPFYHIDHGQLFNNNGSIKGESPYNAWNGTGKGRRFEFETIWIDKNVTLASAAVGRPDGNQGTYSEQCLWRMAVTGQTYGARMMSGNAGGFGDTDGRSPYHEIGQFRNMMVQMVKHTSAYSNYIWFAIPDSLNQLTTTGESNFWDVQQYKWIGNNLYLNLGNEVYVTLKPYPTPTISVNTSYTESSAHSSLQFKWGANVLGTVVMEVTTGREFSSFDDFVNIAKNLSISSIDVSTTQYTGTSGNTIKMQYTAPIPFTMTPYTYDTPYTNPFSPAGNYPKVWGNGNYIDFQTWDSYKTVYGHDLVNQKWGSGTMTLKSRTDSAKVVIDPATAEASFFINKKSVTTSDKKKLNNEVVNANFEIYPNPVENELIIKSVNQIICFKIYNIFGQLIQTTVGNKEDTYRLNTANLETGIYLLKTTTEDGQIVVRKFVKK